LFMLLRLACLFIGHRVTGCNTTIMRPEHGRGRRRGSRISSQTIRPSGRTWFSQLLITGSAFSYPISSQYRLNACARISCTCHDPSAITVSRRTRRAPADFAAIDPSTNTATMRTWQTCDLWSSCAIRRLSDTEDSADIAVASSRISLKPCATTETLCWISFTSTISSVPCSGYRQSLSQAIASPFLKPIGGVFLALGGSESTVAMSLFSRASDVNLKAQRIPNSLAPRTFFSLSSTKAT
jgi:hypothetical protein